MRSTTASVLLALLLLPAVTAAQQPAITDARTVTVQATGVVERPPDRAVVDVAVETFAPTADAAAAENARVTRSVIEALRRAGIPEDAIRTVSYLLRPEYEVERTPDGPDRRIVGYRAVNTVEATVDDLERVGAVIDAAIDAGANRVAGLRFELADPDAARREALRNAVERASADAEAIAEAAGLRLGPVLRVSTTGAPDVRVLARTAAPETALAAPTPVEPGPIRTTADVTVVYELQPR